MHARLVLLALFLLIASAAWAQVGADWTAATGGSIRPGYDLNPCSATNSGALRYNTTVSQFQVCYGSGGWATLADASGTTPFYTDRVTSGTAGVFVSNTGIINFRTGGITTGYFDASGLLVAPGISITTANGISSTSGYFSKKTFLGENASTLAPFVSASNIISGALYIAPRTDYGPSNDGFLTVAASVGGAFFLGKQVGTTYSHNRAVFAAETDNPNGASNFFFRGTASGASKAFIRADGFAYFANKLGIGVISPSEASAIEVSGTVSATRFVGDGSGLTNLNLANVVNDRIVSGSNQVTVNSDGVVSITQAGINWAYINQTLGFVGPGFSLSSIGKTINMSPVNVFSYNGQTMHHYGLGWFSDSTDNWNLGGPTAWFAGFGGIKFFTAGTPRMVISPGGNVGIGTTNPNARLEVTGTISATSFTGDGSALTGVGGIPSGAILAFDLASCPSGWSEYVQARGRFLRGIDNGAGNDPSGTRPAGSIQDDTLQNITGTIATGIRYGSIAGTGVFDAPVAKNSLIFTGTPGAGFIPEFTFDASRVARTSTETRPKNVAVLYCRKN